jgi:hypothetical protein
LVRPSTGGDSERRTDMDVRKGEAVEHELDAIIRRRHDARVIQEGERPAHEAWVESERREDARKARARSWRRMSRYIRVRLERMEANAPAPERPPENREKMRDTLERMAAWRRAGSPDTEEGRKFVALTDAIRRRRARIRGEGA